jgi:ATP synthase, F1 gamma subunit
MAGTSMRDIRRRIRSVASIEKITNAMKLVSAAKLRRARYTFDKTHEALEFITESIDQLCRSAEALPSHYLVGAREIKRKGYIVVTSNRGLAGSYNSNILKEVEKYIKADASKPLFVCVGGRGMKYCEAHGYEILSHYLDPPENITFEETKGLVDPLLELYNKEEIDEIVIVFTKFVTTLEQHVRLKKLLPFDPKEQIETEKKNFKKLSEYDPGPDEVFDYLIPKYAEIMTHRALLEAATCEHAARRLAMQSATDNAHEVEEHLEFYYNQARQAAITSEITEIVSGADAVS